MDKLIFCINKVEKVLPYFTVKRLDLMEPFLLFSYKFQYKITQTQDFNLGNTIYTVIKMNSYYALYNIL